MVYKRQVARLPPEGAETGIKSKPRLSRSSELLCSLQLGDSAAGEELFARYLPYLRRWASGRIPRYARSLLETDDIVQDTLHKTLRNLDRFEQKGTGAFQHYLRTAIRNRIRDAIKSALRNPSPDSYEEGCTSTLSPLEELLGKERLERFEQALAEMRPQDRDITVARLEYGMTYAEIADNFEKPSEDSARMAVRRAIGRLAIRMRDLR